MSGKRAKERRNNVWVQLAGELASMEDGDMMVRDLCTDGTTQKRFFIVSIPAAMHDLSPMEIAEMFVDTSALAKTADNTWGLQQDENVQPTQEHPSGEPGSSQEG